MRINPQWFEEEEDMSAKEQSSKAVTVKGEVFNRIMDGLKANIYVTDVNTDEIIFMNQTMKDDFGLTNPEGGTCWEVLQEGQCARCEFCPVDILRQSKDSDFVYQWDEMNTVTGRAYRNYDCLMEWVDGRMVHLQQSIDVTEINLANTDELTLLFTRKYGKQRLEEFLREAESQEQALTICLYDINLLKDVNDTYGHAEGDHLISTIANAVRMNLNESEFAFRLSGDEFVIVFACRQKEAQKRVDKIKRILEMHKRDYELSFCYGFADFIPKRPATVDELLFFADKRMYEQKRRFHIRRNEALLGMGVAERSQDCFEYAQERLYDALIQSTDDYIYICNMKTGIFKYSANMVEEFNLPQQVIENAAAVWGAKVHPEDKAAFLESNQEIADGRATAHCVEYRAQNREGEWVWVRCRGHLELDQNDEPLLFAGFITNLGKKNKIDNLTGLFNKLEFREQVERLVAEKHPFSVMLLGIDDLKHINDLYNRTFGDEVIRVVSQRIQSLLPSGSTIYRLDGDVFGLISRDARVEDMAAIFRAVYQSFEGQQTLVGKKYYCTLSGGCLFYPDNANSYEDIIKYANYCMEFSKKNGKKRCTYYSQDILDERAHALAMVELLRESVENQFRGFRLVYQPLVCARTGKIIGAEALARWECKELGQVSPMEFIPLLESTGLIVEVGKWILKKALDTAKKWVLQDPDFIIDVNLSYIQILEEDFLSNLCTIMEEAEFQAHNLVLELTENYFVKVNEGIRAIFREIRDMGIRIAMDDFGTGYSTLGLLKEAPADVVKIDKTFVRDIGSGSFDATFIRFVVELCHNVGIIVCLEGVESKEIYDIVTPMGLDLIQGYLFDKPMEEEDFTDKYFK